VPAEAPTPRDSAPASLPEVLDALAEQLGSVASMLRDLLSRGLLFDGAEHVRWQLLTVLNSLGLHEGTVRELRRLVDRTEPR